MGHTRRIVSIRTRTLKVPSRTYHVKTTIQVDGQLKVAASAFMFSVPLCPEVAYGRALESAVNDEPSTVYDQCDN